ncbi:MarR family winged helix-turn-helix transcriptional regulator [Melittangium boletus]|uniref:MarR family transcriptional regulator n=1 Tax=Melittangium boletus DSM 14713 TaxID=1294270 RepID=A0A250IKN6_9BACT|nr:MarR family winged helix-turn-helix transcriptional regulator [Melittangium boletus]ATB32339.1 MarR family transcriptional regulator [Melittangium boletus DSM 14713]
MKPKKKSPEASQPDLKPIQCVCTNLKMASRVVGRAYDLALEESGVNVIQYSILINVSRYQPISQMRLAEHLEMERTTLYRALDILEKKGLVASESNGEGVAKVVRLTARGTDVTSAAARKWNLMHEGFLSKFGPRRLKELNALLGEVRDHFKHVNPST